MVFADHRVVVMIDGRPLDTEQVIPSNSGCEGMRRAWVVTVGMGYGHQRAAYPLRGIACERVITANADKMVDPREQRRWKGVQAFYEGVSRLCSVPLVGKPLWSLYDRLQRIADLYPSRDLSRPTLGVLYLDRLLNKGFGQGMAEYVKAVDIPFVSTFFVPPLAAARAGIKRVFSVVTDVDINRIWVARHPETCPVHYLVPSMIAWKRLIQYGVRPEKITFTGFPLPEENLATLEQDLRGRIRRLDPVGRFAARYGDVAGFNGVATGEGGHAPITLTYAVGGAGAQKDVAASILEGLAPDLKAGIYRLNLIAGTRLEVRRFFMDAIRKYGLESLVGNGIEVQCALDIPSYFATFNRMLKDTDILWTKPSELVFYAGLGIPLIMSAPLGAHEETNRNWIRNMGAGFVQENPRFAREWLREWIASGMLAEAAFDAYVKAPRHGTENIRRVIFADDPSDVELVGDHAATVLAPEWR